MVTKAGLTVLKKIAYLFFTGQGSIADFVQQLGGTLTVEGFDVVLAQFGVTVSLFKRNSRLIMVVFKLVGFMVFNATFNTISVISWRSVLLVEETPAPRGNNRPAASH